MKKRVNYPKVGKGLSKCTHFQNARKCAHFQNVHSLCKLDENMCISTKMCAFSKNKFSEIGLASSKGLFFERPNEMLIDSR